MLASFSRIRKAIITPAFYPLSISHVSWSKSWFLGTLTVILETVINASRVLLKTYGSLRFGYAYRKFECAIASSNARQNNGKHEYGVFSK